LSAPVLADLGIPSDIQMPPDQVMPLTLDLAMPDLGVADLAAPDLAMPDLAMPDLVTPDLAGADLTPPPVRHVFLLTPVMSSNLGPQMNLDVSCSTQAMTAQIPGSPNYRAVISYPGVDAALHIKLGEGRAIVLPSGAPVAQDSTFFTQNHDGPIDEQADGTRVAMGCVWTDSGPSGSSVPGGFDCMGWSTTTMGNAVVGDCTAADINWTINTVVGCGTMNCFVYCIEQ
jgi:hypothetical protein